MKILTFIFFVLIGFKSFGQVKEASQNAVVRDPIYFLDSVKINKNQMFFDPDKIAAINVVKDKDTLNQKEGKIYIKSKNPIDYNFLTLKSIKKHM